MDRKQRNVGITIGKSLWRGLLVWLNGCGCVMLVPKPDLNPADITTIVNTGNIAITKADVIVLSLVLSSYTELVRLGGFCIGLYFLDRSRRKKHTSPNPSTDEPMKEEEADTSAQDEPQDRIEEAE
ncbi:MAG: hypothetical protein LBN39_11060 [Planctomycetaceae bacterium]|nr:hypothetical protein [Planctomycetaceae bacterium]